MAIKILAKLPFKYKHTLEYVSINQKIETIGAECFLKFDNLKTVIVNKECKVVEKEAFGFCDKLNHVELNKVKIIGMGAFWNCKNLKEIELPAGLKVIGDFCFKGCENLETIVIPTSVTYVGKYAFWGCKNLKKIVYMNSKLSEEEMSKGNNARFLRLRGSYYNIIKNKGDK